MSRALRIEHFSLLLPAPVPCYVTRTREKLSGTRTCTCKEPTRTHPYPSIAHMPKSSMITRDF